MRGTKGAVAFAYNGLVSLGVFALYDLASRGWRAVARLCRNHTATALAIAQADSLARASAQAFHSLAISLRRIHSHSLSLGRSRQLALSRSLCTHLFLLPESLELSHHIPTTL